MSTRPDPDIVIASWLRDEAQDGASDRLLAATRQQIESTHQRPSWWPARRLREMNSPMRIVIAAAAVAAVAVVGINVLPKSGGVGGSGPSASPAPSASAAPSLAPSASPGPLPIGTIPAGTYVMTPFAGVDSKVNVCLQPPQPGCTEPAADNARAESIRLTLTVPVGWTSPETANVWLAGKDFTAPDGAGLFINRGAWLLTEPCQNGRDPDIPVGPTVDAFVNAIAAHPILDTTTPVDVTLGGYSGKYIDLHVPSDISKCDVYRPWEPGMYAAGPSHQWHLWILDVGGVRVIIQSMDYAATSPKNRDELQAIVESIQIQP